jgi:hypothetical protein
MDPEEKIIALALIAALLLGVVLVGGSREKVRDSGWRTEFDFVTSHGRVVGFSDPG